MPSPERNLRKLHHWNRRAWEEIVILRKRVEIIERQTGVETGGDYYFREDEKPWEVETVYDYRLTIFAFFFGMFVGAAIMVAILVGR